MRKFKPNRITTFQFTMADILLPFSAGIPLMVVLMDVEHYSARDMLHMAFGMVAIVVLWHVVCTVLHLLIWPFDKYKVFLEDECFYYEGGTRVWYCDVTEIVFDSGFAGKGGSNEHCCLDCYGGNKMLFSVNHPSLVMTVLLIKRCKNAKVRYRRIKQMIGMWAFCVVICVAAGLYGRFGG